MINICAKMVKNDSFLPPLRNPVPLVRIQSDAPCVPSLLGHKKSSTQVEFFYFHLLVPYCLFKQDKSKFVTLGGLANPSQCSLRIQSDAPKLRAFGSFIKNH